MGGNEEELERRTCGGIDWILARGGGKVVVVVEAVWVR